jgi:catechol 2,3-dioxygenase-like lactoylglutathione lyase family enzyme
MPTFLEVTPRLPVNDLRKTIDFYTTRLGFIVDLVWPDTDPTFVILNRDKVRLAFFEPDEQRPGPLGYAQFYLEVTGALEIHQALEATTTIDWGPEVYSYGRREFAVTDPNGYLIIFTEETSDPPTTSEPD